MCNLKKMKKTAFIIICSLVLASCEMISISSRRATTRNFELSQKSPIGVLFLFKIELDSNNIPAASQFIARPEGTKLTAIEKYDMYSEIRLLQRIIRLKNVTHIKSDTLSKVMQRIELEFDYTRNVTFNTEKIKDNWFIVSIEQ
jgi:hypothetical protein